MALSSSDMETKFLHKPMPKFTEADYIRFWGGANITANQDMCWELNIGIGTRGYGRFALNRITYYSHRIAYFLYYKVDPEKRLVCHKCDNPKCVNPNHLFLGTEYDNVRDMMAKSRNTIHGGWTVKGGDIKYGAAHPKAKLSEPEVIKIRELYSKGGVTQRGLAKKYNIDCAVIHLIIHKKIWKHI